MGDGVSIWDTMTSHFKAGLVDPKEVIREFRERADESEEPPHDPVPARRNSGPNSPPHAHHMFHDMIQHQHDADSAPNLLRH